MPDAEFEKTFSDLAHARLRDKAPGLLDHLVGFQLLDKSDDDTRAVGVWGFKVGNEWMYAPVFFLNGQLKGDELLYLKSQDAFVPLKENWVNYLLNRRPYVLGETEPRGQYELGIMQPDFNAIVRPPYAGSKYASADGLRGLVDYLSETVADDFKPFLPVVMSPPGGEKRASLYNKWNLPTFIKRAGNKAARTLLATIRKNASFAEGVLKFYRMEDIIDAAKEAFSKGADDGDKMIEDTAPTVEVMLSDRANVLDLDDVALTDEEKERLQSDRYVVRDRRGDDEVGRVYSRQISKTLQNPCMSGYHNVLLASGNFEPRLVITSPVGCERYRNRNRGLAVVVNPKTGRMVMGEPKDIFVDNEGPRTDWKETFDGLSNPSSVAERQKVVFVNERGEGTVPFFVYRRVVSDGQTALYGEFDEYPTISTNHSTKKLLYPEFRGRAFNDTDAPRSGYYDSVEISSGRGGPCIILTNKPGNTVTQIGKDFFIPLGFKAIKIAREDIEPWKLDRDNKLINREYQNVSPEALAVPQTLADIEMQLFKTAGVKEVQIVTDGIEWWIRDDGNIGRPMSKLAALKKLIMDYTLREKDALGLLKTGSRSAAPKFIVKVAQQPTAPAIPEPMMASDPTLTMSPPVLYPQEELISANQQPMDRYGQPIDMDATFRAQQASQLGQKEVLDTSVITGLVKSMNPNTVVDEYVGDLMLGLDRIGRIMFMYYWHFDKFKERYGSQDMPELEDNLTNVFDNLGDLTLFLKQKTIEPDVSSAEEAAELEEVL